MRNKDVIFLWFIVIYVVGCVGLTVAKCLIAAAWYQGITLILFAVLVVAKQTINRFALWLEKSFRHWR